MHSFIDYLLQNKQWIFDGCGIFVIGGVISCLVWMIRVALIRSRSGKRPPARQQNDTDAPRDGHTPQQWQGILPPKSRYRFFTETESSIPFLQSHSFEFGPNGHAAALSLKGSRVRADIQFTCQLLNAAKASSSSSGYSMNELPPKFLAQARIILERSSLTFVREHREELATAIREKASPEFKDLGFLLTSVTIGSLETIPQTKQP